MPYFIFSSFFPYERTDDAFYFLLFCTSRGDDKRRMVNGIEEEVVVWEG